MPRPANWKSDGPTRMERIRHLSWSHYRDIWVSYADYRAQVQPRAATEGSTLSRGPNDALSLDAAARRHEERHATKFPGRDGNHSLASTFATLRAAFAFLAASRRASSATNCAQV